MLVLYDIENKLLKFIKFKRSIEALNSVMAVLVFHHSGIVCKTK